MIRAAFRIAGLILALLVGLPLHGAWRLVGAPSPWPRQFLGTAARIVGARRQIHGTPLTRDVAIVANHLSWIDILLLAGETGCAFVAKGDLDRVPLIGWLCRLNGTIFVDRADRMGVVAQVARLRAEVARGRPVALFPEGTTGDGRTLLPFKASLFAMLDPPPPGVRVQPVRIDYGGATGELAWVGAESGIAHALRVLRRKGHFTARLSFAESFAPEGGRKAIAAEARRRIVGPGD